MSFKIGQRVRFVGKSPNYPQVVNGIGRVVGFDISPLDPRHTVMVVFDGYKHPKRHDGFLYADPTTLIPIDDSRDLTSWSEVQKLTGYVPATVRV